MALISCPTCQRHVREADHRCPFCARSLSAEVVKRAGVLLGVSAVAFGCQTGASDTGNPPSRTPNDANPVSHTSEVKQEAIPVPAYGAPPPVFVPPATATGSVTAKPTAPTPQPPPPRKPG